MGYYIQVPENKHKAEQIVNIYGGQIISRPASFADVPEGKGLICVADNGPFEAAGFIYNEREFEAFSAPDYRHKDWVLVDLAVAKEESGYRG